MDNVVLIGYMKIYRGKEGRFRKLYSEVYQLLIFKRRLK